MAILSKFIKHVKNPSIAFVIFAIWVLVFIIISAEMGAFSGNFTQWGPADDPEDQIKFMGSKVDSWNKVYQIWAVGFFTVAFSAYFNQIVNPWITLNIQNDDKTDIKYKKIWSYVIAIGDPFLGWLNGILGFQVLMTGQLQFIVPQMLGEIFVIIITTYARLNTKTFGNAGLFDNVEEVTEENIPLLTDEIEFSDLLELPETPELKRLKTA